MTLAAGSSYIYFYFGSTMHLITDQSGKPIAFLHSNAIVQLPDYRPVGILLGNSLYGLHAQPCGRIFKGYIRHHSGKLIGKLEKNEERVVAPAVIQECMELAWQIIAGMQGDGCLWVEEDTEWSPLSLLDVLTTQVAVVTGRQLATGSFR